MTLNMSLQKNVSPIFDSEKGVARPVTQVLVPMWKALDPGAKIKT